MSDDWKTIKYSTAIRLMEPGDVLLFRGFSLVSFLISGFTDSVYTHAAVVDKFELDGTPYCEILQFREFRGGVASNLWRDVLKYSGKIDVFRPERSVEASDFDAKTGEIKTITVPFDSAKFVAKMRKLTGQDYGYARILAFWLRIVPFVRLFVPRRANNLAPKRFDFPVCSTSVAWSAYRTGYFFIRKNPNWTTPGDLSDSPRLSYLFTLEKD